MPLVPHPRLLLLTALLLVPALGLWVALPALEPGLALVTAAVACAGVIDGWRGVRRLRGLQVELPPVQRLSKDRPGRIQLSLALPATGLTRLRLGLPWPEAFVETDEILAIDLPPAAARARVDWPCRARRRGVFRLGVCGVEADSPWGLWQARRLLPLPGELRVYPGLLRERRQVSALFLPRASGGVKPQRQLGQGRDFEKLRDYLPGDGWDEIHWKASAKRGRPVTKLFQVERTQEIYLVLDHSRLSARPLSGPDSGGSPDTALERTLNAALVLALAAQRQGDLFGFVTFSDRVRTFLRAAGGNAHFIRCREALHTLEPEDVSPDFGELFTALRLRLRRRALLVILTALDDPVLAEEFEAGARLVARQHLVLVSQIALDSARPLLSGSAPQSPQDICRQLAGHTRWQTVRALAGRLERLGLSFSLLPAGELAADLVSQYMAVKRRQRL